LVNCYHPVRDLCEDPGGLQGKKGKKNEPPQVALVELEKLLLINSPPIPGKTATPPLYYRKHNQYPRPKGLRGVLHLNLSGKVVK